MPRLDGDMENYSIGKGGFAFTGARMDKLEATDYTLVTIAVDKTGSVSSFVSDLEKMERTAIAACKKSPRSDNIMIRLIRFSASDIEEVFGFKPLNDIDETMISPIRAYGGTPLYDTAYAVPAATIEYGKQLRANDYGVNGIAFIITDGDDNTSKFTPDMVKKEHEKAITGEELESYISILVGVNAQQYRPYLERFAVEGGFTQYVDVEDATSQKLAKLAAFISKSVSSQSQAMGTGGPSQNIDLTI